MVIEIPHPRKVLLLALLNVTDLILTWYLVQTGVFYERNPLAEWCLARSGWAGLAAFKIGLMVFVSWLFVRISHHSARVGNALLIGSYGGFGYPGVGGYGGFGYPGFGGVGGLGYPGFGSFGGRGGG